MATGGLWAWIWAQLQAWIEAASVITWQVSVDSTINRAHQHAAGARYRPDAQVEPPGDEPDDHALGRCRGGVSTTIHLACEQSRKPLSLLLTAGQAGDSLQMIPLLEAIQVTRVGSGRARTRPQRVLADKACSSVANRRYPRRRGIPATIAIPTDQAARRRARGTAGNRPPVFSPRLHQRRHAVECGINQLTHHHAVAGRSDTLAVRYETTLHVTTLHIWLRPLTKNTS